MHSAVQFLAKTASVKEFVSNLELLAIFTYSDFVSVVTRRVNYGLNTREIPRDLLRALTIFNRMDSDYI